MSKPDVFEQARVIVGSYFSRNPAGSWGWVPEMRDYLVANGWTILIYDDGGQRVGVTLRKDTMNAVVMVNGRDIPEAMAEAVVRSVVTSRIHHEIQDPYRRPPG